MPHEVLTVTRTDDGWLGRCDCGWSTPPARTGSEVGEAWDRHRSGLVAGGTPQVQMH